MRQIGYHLDGLFVRTISDFVERQRKKNRKRKSRRQPVQTQSDCVDDDSLEQFEVADQRTPSQVADMLTGKNLEPVWKDFDRSFLFDQG